MPKIPRNLTDKDMLKGYKETTIEEDLLARQTPEENKQTAQEKHFAALQYLALTPELAKKIDKSLMELQVKLYNLGVTDYVLEPRLEGKNVIIVPVERKGRK